MAGSKVDKTNHLLNNSATDILSIPVTPRTPRPLTGMNIKIIVCFLNHLVNFVGYKPQPIISVMQSKVRNLK